MTDAGLADAPAGPPAPVAADLMELPAARLDPILGSARAGAVTLIVDWLVRRARDQSLGPERISQLCESFVDLGIPLDRYGSSTEILDSEHDAVARLWLRGEGVTTRQYMRDETEAAYRRSPFFEAAETGRAVEMWLPATGDDRFDIVPELRADGFVHYICVPIGLMNGGHGWVTFATRSPDGFSAADVAAFARVMPAIAVLLDLRSNFLSLDRLLRTYVGEEPHRAILRGNTKRGQVRVIRAAILMADMRDSVAHTVGMEARAAVDLFNAFFDCLVPPIEGRRGEVLKYIGDGLLAIFRDRREGQRDGADRALAAAREAQVRLDALNAGRGEAPPIRAGFALHYGETAYGNVGSGRRLDFTVIGKDVALASRIAGMNRGLDEAVLISGDAAARMRGSTERVGAHLVRGFSEPIEVFRPRPEPS